MQTFEKKIRIKKLKFTGRFLKMKNAGGYYVIVIEDQSCRKVIGCATLLVEQKFIHNCALVNPTKILYKITTLFFKTSIQI